ncbi:hypothetical protein [Bartonella sp. CB169]|uniref:hypothetical protein n=1 Tax=Bartonella sp. CB169 TaxID=3112257 RepID=UPI00300DCCB4
MDDNDILAHISSNSTYNAQLIPHTTSLLIDIQASSNVKRFLFKNDNRKSIWIRSAMENLKKSRYFDLNKKQLKSVHYLFSFRTSCKNKKLPFSIIAIFTTAHPAKLPDAIKSVCRLNPPRTFCLKNLMKHKDYFIGLANNAKNSKRLHFLKVTCILLNLVALFQIKNIPMPL